MNEDMNSTRQHNSNAGLHTECDTAAEEGTGVVTNPTRVAGGAAVRRRKKKSAAAWLGVEQVEPNQGVQNGRNNTDGSRWGERGVGTARVNSKRRARIAVIEITVCVLTLWAEGSAFRLERIGRTQSSILTAGGAFGSIS